MKTTLIPIVIAALLCSCGQKPDARDIKIAKVESRIDKLETNMLNLIAFNTEDRTNTSAALTRIKSTLETMMLDTQAAMARSSELEYQLNWALTNRPPQARSPVIYAQPTATAYKDGIPITIYNSIASEASRKWPGNYEMQVFVIKEQVEAYKKLHQ